MKYQLYYQKHGVPNVFMYTIEARMLSDALYSFLKKCQEDEESNIFFDLRDASLYDYDLNVLKHDPKFHQVKTKDGTFGIVLVGVKIEDENRNPYLLDLRATREWLGISCDKMAELTEQKDYKYRELGHRKLTIDEYARYMLILRDVEQRIYSEEDDNEKTD